MGQFFHKNSGSQEDNQVSILGCPHLFLVAEDERTLELHYPGAATSGFVTLSGKTSL